MEVGFFTMPIHPLDKDYRKTLAEDREAFLLADEIGFSEAYCGEHYTDAAENITSSTVFIASLAAATKNIRLGTGTVNLPNSLRNGASKSANKTNPPVQPIRYTDPP